jgi:hypothetical protein
MAMFEVLLREVIIECTMACPTTSTERPPSAHDSRRLDRRTLKEAVTHRRIAAGRIRAALSNEF